MKAGILSNLSDAFMGLPLVNAWQFRRGTPAVQHRAGHLIKNKRGLPKGFSGAKILRKSMLGEIGVRHG